MVEFGITYNYKEICEVLGWRVYNGGNAKKKQIACIEESFEYVHPLSARKKEKKSEWIFLSQIKEPILDDARKQNGGKNSSQPVEEFEYLFNCLITNGMNINQHRQRKHSGEYDDALYISNSIIYKEFGFDYYDMIEQIQVLEWEQYIDYKVWNLFRDIVLQAVKSRTVTRISKKLGYKKNSLPKGILCDAALKGRGTAVQVPMNSLLAEYEKKEKEFCLYYGCKDISDAIRKGFYQKIISDIEKYFKEEKNINGVKKVNRIEMIQLEDFQYDRSLKTQYQIHFYDIVMESIEKSVKKRCEERTSYSKPLAVWMIPAFQYYWKQLNGEEVEPVERPVQIVTEEDEEIFG